jgi:ATP-dependent Clp protease ATP-binding subunit ClpE
VSLEVSDKVIKKIAKEGFSQEYGARNIRRHMQEKLENPLSDLLLEEGVKPTVVNVDVIKDKIVLKASGTA